MRHGDFLQEKYQHEFLPGSPGFHAVFETQNEPASRLLRKFPHLTPYKDQPDLSPFV